VFILYWGEQHCWWRAVVKKENTGDDQTRPLEEAGLIRPFRSMFEAGESVSPENTQAVRLRFRIPYTHANSHSQRRGLKSNWTSEYRNRTTRLIPRINLGVALIQPRASVGVLRQTCSIVQRPQLRSGDIMWGEVACQPAYAHILSSNRESWLCFSTGSSRSTNSLFFAIPTSRLGTKWVHRFHGLLITLVEAPT